jgi:spore maturation protein CgeB
VDPEIIGAVDAYVSRSLSADEFAAVREFARNVVSSLQLESPLSAKNAMRDVSWLAAWCESVAIPLDVKYVFDPATITRYMLTSQGVV